MARVHYREYRGITLLARELRKNQTQSEKILWEELRGKKMMGFKFLRQHPIFYKIDQYWVEFFIADFYCAELKLIIELDGPIHDSNIDYDKERDHKLSSKGLSTIRIKNHEISNLNKVLEIIKSSVVSRLRYSTEI